MEPILHFLIPVLLIMAFFPRIDKKLILKLSILTIIMDFDLIIPNYHRIAFHNIFFMIAIVLLVYFIAGGLASKIALFFMGTHLIFDMFEAGPALLWPIYSSLFSLIIEFYKKVNWHFNFDFSLIPLSEFVRCDTDMYLRPMGSLVLIIVGIIVIAKYFSRRKMRKRI